VPQREQAAAGGPVQQADHSARPGLR
jgi:hypothetical protein